MIRWGTMVRVQGEKGIWLVHDFDLDLSGDLDDPSCIRSVELFEPALPYEEWIREERFLAELDEIVEAEGRERESACPNFEYVIISNYWTEDTPPEQHYSIWVIRSGHGASVWLQRGYHGDIERVCELSDGKVALLEKAFDKAGVRRWAQHHTHDGWRIGSNAWGIKIVQGSTKVTIGGDDGYDQRLRSLCKNMQEIGLPVKFWEGHGLVYDQPRKKGQRR